MISLIYYLLSSEIDKRGITLVFLFFASHFIPTLGSGGTERWVVYPILLWVIGFGAYLLGMATTTLPRSRFSHQDLCGDERITEST